MRLDRQWASEAYAAGWTVRDIAAEAAEAAGMIDATSSKSQRASAGSIVREWRATHGLADPLDAQTRQRLRQWYEVEGLTVVEVGARLGLGRRATAERLRAVGVALRPRGRRAQ